MTISNNLINKYREAANNFIEQLGITCKIVYPPVKGEQCNNCISPSAGSNFAYYRNGGPVSFTGGTCPLCNNVGYKPTESPTENIKLRINYAPESWAKRNGIVLPEGAIQVIGYLSDLPKIRKCQKIQINREIANMMTQDYVLDSEPTPHGFVSRDFFMAILKRI